MPQVYCATLQPASGGFGEWDWVEGFPAEAAETYEEYEAICRDNGQEPVIDNSLSGRIHREQGVIYRFEEGVAPDGSKCRHYEMVWIEEEGS